MRDLPREPMFRYMIWMIVSILLWCAFILVLADAA